MRGTTFERYKCSPCEELTEEHRDQLDAIWQWELDNLMRGD